jgi:hypothetical protein
MRNIIPSLERAMQSFERLSWNLGVKMSRAFAILNKRELKLL